MRKVNIMTVLNFNAWTLIFIHNNIICFPVLPGLLRFASFAAKSRPLCPCPNETMSALDMGEVGCTAEYPAGFYLHMFLFWFVVGKLER